MVKRVGQDLHERGRTYFKEWRKFRNLSQDALAARLETTKSAISKLENGKALYNQSTLEAWAHALDCSPADLISYDPSDEPPLPIFDLPEGDQRMVREFILTLRVRRTSLTGETRLDAETKARPKAAGRAAKRA